MRLPFGRPRAEPAPRPAAPEPEMFEGTTHEPEEGDKERISSAGDVDVNIKRHGMITGAPGGAGGFGGAGTK